MAARRLLNDGTTDEPPGLGAPMTKSPALAAILATATILLAANAQAQELASTDRDLAPIVLRGTAPRSFSRAPRVGMEILGALGGAVLVGGAGFGVAFGACSAASNSSSLFGSDRGWCMGGLGFLAGVAGYVAIPGGVTIVGNAMNGSGGFGWSMLGTFLGTALGAGVTTIGGTVASAGSGNAAPSIVGMGLAAMGMTMPFAGAILGYELSSRDRRDEPTTAARDTERHNGFTFRPDGSVSPANGSVTLGAAGSF